MSQEIYYTNYANLDLQIQMLSDKNRTNTYYNAIVKKNPNDFKNKVILDVGGGTGILSMFAAMAGAKKVYCVEITDIANKARELIQKNNFDHIIEVIEKPMDQIKLPEKVDVIISEWMGVALFHEGMFEIVARARDKYLKPNGKMYPSTGTLYFGLYSEKVKWNRKMSDYLINKNKYNLDFKSLHSDMKQEEDSYYNEDNLVVKHGLFSKISSNIVSHKFNFKTLTQSYLNNFNLPLNFKLKKNTTISSVCIWFDVSFPKGIKLDTSPKKPKTHWKHSFIYFREPIKVNKNDTLQGNINWFHYPNKYSYKLTLNLEHSIKSTQEKEKEKEKEKNLIETSAVSDTYQNF